MATPGTWKNVVVMQRGLSEKAQSFSILEK
jgi:hypothetical protein